MAADNPPRPEPQRCPLSPSELVLVGHLADGRTRAIACRMAGYAATSHNIIVHRIFRKTGARNVAHLTAMAVRNGWIK